MATTPTFDDLLAQLLEAGRTMSGANLTKLHSAIDQLGAVHDGTCDLGDACPNNLTHAESDWSAEIPGMPISEAGAPLTQKQRDELPDADFAGKNQSFYIKVPQDVADAAKAIGRAGPDNYDGATLKANIIRIANRKGAAFVAQLPEAWKTKESETLIDGGFIQLAEKALARDGVISLKVIQPGWGTSGYYGKDVLERDSAAAFPAGTKMYWNHPTLEEDRQRPERDLRDLAAELVSPAAWKENGAAGPGVYADAKVFDHYQPVVEELAPHIGVSIRAMGAAKAGEAEGRKGQIIEKIVAGKSIDFVTAPGAGGKVLQLFESARGGHIPQEGIMNEAEIKALQESEATAKKAAAEATAKAETAEKELVALKESSARSTEALMVIEAKGIVTEILGKTQLPEVTRARLVESLSKSPPIKDGKIDKDAYGKAIEEAAKAEIAYLTAVTGGGKITGMGGGGGSEPKLEESEKQLQEAFQRMGLLESTAKLATAGR